MRNIKEEVNLDKKIILLRLDLNVPLDNGKITDTTRIDKIIPTINFLLKNKLYYLSFRWLLFNWPIDFRILNWASK